MKLFAIADLHLSFCPTIDKPMSVFGEGWENYEERIRTSWQKNISDEDCVLIPGDISWGLKLNEAMEDIEWLHNLPGKKILVKGNHDLWWSKITYMNSLYDDMIFLQNSSCFLEEIDTAIAGTRGWNYPGLDDYTEHDEKLYARELLRMRMSLESAKKSNPKEIIAMMHYPPASNVSKKSDFTELFEEFNVSKCVYGHLHGAVAFGKGIKGVVNGIEYSLVSVDYLGAEPKLIRG